MNESEFDKFADEYQKLHAASIRLSGETPDYFTRYKVMDVARLLGPARQNDLRILDFGSGVGTSVPHFRELLPASRITCLDVSTRSLDIGRARYSEQAEFLCFDGKKIPLPDSTFDLSFAACVFHHIDHDEHPGILHEWLRVLRPGGYGVIFEHNALNPLTRQAVSNCPFDEHAVLVKAADLVRRMRVAGFREVFHRYRIFFPGMLRPLRVLEPCLSWLPLGAQYCVVGRK